MITDKDYLQNLVGISQFTPLDLGYGLDDQIDCYILSVQMVWSDRFDNGEYKSETTIVVVIIVGKHISPVHVSKWARLQ